MGQGATRSDPAVGMEALGEGDPTLGWSTVRTGAPATLLPDPDPVELFCPLISADDHFFEPPHIFDRVPARLRDQAPRVEEDDGGIPYWVIGGTRHPLQLNSAAVGRPRSEWSLAPQKWEELRRAVWDVHERVRDMDINGVYAAINFPGVPWGFAGTQLARLPDWEVGLASVRAYNSWVLEDWCGVYPDRFIPCQIPWLNDPEVAAAEIRANAERGFRAVSFSENPEALGFPGLYTRHWDPFFRACEETETVINLHAGSSGQVTRPSAGSPIEALNALFPLNAMIAVVDWIFAKIPLRFPRIRIVLAEGGVSWVPMMYERLDRAFRLSDASTTWDLADGPPADLLRRNFWFTSIEDPSAFRLLDVIGADRVMVESDYPHTDGSWPETQVLVRAGVEHLPAETIRQLCYGSASELYQHPLPPKEWLDRSVVGAP